MSLLILSASDVDRITVNLSPDELMQSMANVFSTVSRSSSQASSAEEPYYLPHRTTVNMSHHKSLFMPSRVASVGTAIKVVSVPTSPAAQPGGLPASTLVLDEDTGRVKAIVNARSLTALRNAAGSALATKLALSLPGRNPEPKVLVLFGAGQQIAAHAHLFLRVFPSLTECHIINRSDSSRLQDLKASLERAYPTKSIRTHGGERRTAGDTDAVVGAADIICTATSSTSLLFPAALVKPGAHLNLIGSFTPHMKEIGVELVQRAGPVIVESAEAALAEAGELIEARYARENVVEIGKLVSSGEERRSFGSRAGDVTIFKSVGIGLQDVAIASLVVEKAKELGLGTTIDSYDM